MKEREAEDAADEVAPISLLHVEAVLPHVSRQVAAAIRLQLARLARSSRFSRGSSGDGDGGAAALTH